jgi:hypothetical protein
MLKRVLLVIILLMILIPAQGKSTQPEDSTWNKWHFRISPYFWYIGLQGTIYRPPQPTGLPEPPPPRYEIDVSFKDIRHSIKFAAMLAGRYRGKRIVTQFNFATLILESEAITPFELVFQDIVLKLNYFSGDLAAGYRIIRKDKLQLDGMVGLKFIYFKIGGRSTVLGSIPLEGERDHLWLDPVIGANIIYRPHKRIELGAYGDYGGPLGETKMSYQVIAAGTYHISRVFHISVGYRLWGVEHNVREAIFNGHVKGWLMRFGFQF